MFGGKHTIDPLGTPWGEVVKAFAKVPYDIVQDIKGMTHRSHVGDYITAVGYAGKIPGMGQIAASAQYYFDQQAGIQPNTGWADAMRGYLFGRSAPGEPLKVPRGRSTTFRRY